MYWIALIKCSVTFKSFKITINCGLLSYYLNISPLAFWKTTLKQLFLISLGQSTKIKNILGTNVLLGMCSITQHRKTVLMVHLWEEFVFSPQKKMVHF